MQQEEEAERQREALKRALRAEAQAKEQQKLQTESKAAHPEVKAINRKQRKQLEQAERR